MTIAASIRHSALTWPMAPLGYVEGSYGGMSRER